MNRRPLLLMLACFVFGEISVYAEKQWIIVIGAAVLLGFLVSFVYVNKSYPALLLFALCFIVGQLRCYDVMKPGLLELYKESSLSVHVTGQVDKIEAASDGYRIYIKKVNYTYNYNMEERQYNTSRRLMFTVEKDTLKLGQWIRVDGQIKPLSRATNPGGFDSFTYYCGRNVEYQLKVKELTVSNVQCWRLLEYLRCMQKKLMRQTELLLEKNQAGVLAAMLLGERSLLDKDVKRLYQDAGIAHLIAISGLHIGFFGLLLFRMLRLLSFSYPVSGLIAGGVLLSYGAMTGCSVSCERAVIMLLVSFLGKVLGRAYDMLSAMSLAGLILLFIRPLQFIDAGFLLSFGAIAGIGVVYPVFKSIAKSSFSSGKLGWLGQQLTDNLLLSSSVQLATLPVVAWFYYQLPLYQLMLNLLVLPLMSLLLPVSVIAIILSLLYFPLGKLFMLPAQWILQFFELAGGVTNHLPGSLLVCGQPGLWQIAGYYGVLVGILFVIYYGKKGYSLAALPLLFSLLLYQGSPGLSVTMLDVGQGDGLVIETPGRHVLLVDGGSTSKEKLYEYTYEPYLKSQGITKIEAIIVTHCDEDHISGLMELIQKGYPIGGIYLPRLMTPDEEYLEFQTIAKKYHIPVGYLSAGDSFSIDGVDISCLHPRSGESYESANSYSTTLSLSYGSFSMLFTGDLEGKGEEEVIHRLLEQKRSDYTVLKVAHHGSKNSSSEEFLNIVSPTVALISCADNNLYGHPHRELLERLRVAGARHYETPNSGAIRIVAGKTVLLTEYLKEKW